MPTQTGPFAIASSIVDRIAIVANAAGSLVVLLLVVAVNFDVVARGMFNQPFRGAVEVVQFSMALIVFLQLPDVIRVNRLTRSDGFLLVMDRRNARTSHFLRRMIDTVSAILMALIAVTMWPEFVDAWESKDFFGTPGIFTAPWWPVKLIIFLSAALCCLIFISKAIRGKSVEPDDGEAAAIADEPGT